MFNNHSPGWHRSLSCSCQIWDWTTHYCHCSFTSWPTLFPFPSKAMFPIWSSRTHRRSTFLLPPSRSKNVTICRSPRSILGNATLMSFNESCSCRSLFLMRQWVLISNGRLSRSKGLAHLGSTADLLPQSFPPVDLSRWEVRATVGQAEHHVGWADALTTIQWENH